MKILIGLLLLSSVLGVLLALRLMSLKGTGILEDLNRSMEEAQKANREILRRRFGHDSGPAGLGGDGLFEVIASPMFSFACIAIAVILFAHPESMAYHDSLDSLPVKGVLLLVGQMTLVSLFVCSISLTILQRRKK